MTKAEILYHEIAAGIPDTKQGKMFGAQVIKAPNGKAGVMFWKEYLVVKLEGKDAEDTMKLDGAKIFSPMDGRPMNGWIQLSYAHAARWRGLAEKAMAYVKTLKK